MTTTTTEQPQHMKALAKANRLRFARVGYKRKLAIGPTRFDSLGAFAQLIADPPEELHGMKVVELLGSCRRVSVGMAARMLEPPVLCRALRKIGDLTPGERARVITMVDETIAGRHTWRPVR